MTIFLILKNPYYIFCVNLKYVSTKLPTYLHTFCWYIIIKIREEVFTFHKKSYFDLFLYAIMKSAFIFL